MVKEYTIQNSLEDSLKTFSVPDFSGGLNSETDPQDLESNQSSDCQNVKLLKGGRVIGRDGWIERVVLPKAPDGAFFFYDSAGAGRLVSFSNGNLYDNTSFALTLIQASCYAAGKRVTACVLNSILYFSDGETITTSGSDHSGIYYWNPVSSPTAAALLISAGGSGIIETPAAKVLRTYAGAIILGCVRYVSGTYATDTLHWCDVNDPTTIRGTNIFRIGAGQGGEINCIVPMGVSAEGVAPYHAIFVGKSKYGIYHLRGALAPDSLEEVMITAATGVRDGLSCQFVPGPDASGFVVWLGNDSKVWYTNGVNSGELSGSIRKELAGAIADRLPLTPRFTSVRNFNDFQYILDLGADSTGVTKAYCYDWDRKAWTRYAGWPSGYWAEGVDGSSCHAIYCASDTGGYRMTQANIGSTDNGAAISPYWKTGYLHCGDPDSFKVWNWVYLTYATDSGALTITATVNLGAGHSTTKTLTTKAAALGLVRWGTATWDSSLWEAGSGDSYGNYKDRARLTYQTTGLDGSKELLAGSDIQLTVAPTSDSGHFELFGFELLYLQRGRRRVVA